MVLLDALTHVDVVVVMVETTPTTAAEEDCEHYAEEDNAYGYDNAGAYMVYGSQALFASDSIPSRTGYITWILDSACTEHLIYDSHAFTMVQTSHHHIHVAEGIVSYFRNVYPYPEIMRNVFSEETLEDANWIIIGRLLCQPAGPPMSPGLSVTLAR